MQPTSPETWKPGDNHLLVAVPERLTTTAVPGKPLLVMISGSDDWAALDEDLRAGRNAPIETDSPLPQTPVRQGLVLAVPERLTAEMELCAGPWMKQVPRYKTVPDAKGKARRGQDGRAVLVSDGYTEGNVMRTCADITQRVAVGDTIHFDHSYLTDEAEISPGVYRLPYVAVICIIEPPTMTEGGMGITMRNGNPAYYFLNDLDLKRGFQNGRHLPKLKPIGSYLLLSRVWADDVQEAEIEGRTRKVRYGKGDLIDQIDVPPLPNEGVIACMGSPLRGTSDTLQVGDRVVSHGYKAHSDKSHALDTGQAREETIAGVEYLAVRQDYVLAVREPSLETRISKALSGAEPVLAQMGRDEFAHGQSRCHVGPNGLRLLTDAEHKRIDNLPMPWGFNIPAGDSEFYNDAHGSLVNRAQAEKFQDYMQASWEVRHECVTPNYLPLHHPAYNA